MDSDQTCFQNDRNNVCRSKLEDRLNRFKSYGQKSGQIWVSERFFEKISRNITDTEKMMMTKIIGNFVADNIVFERSKIGPVDPEIWAKKCKIMMPERFF